jgi:hypothetical protein
MFARCPEVLMGFLASAPGQTAKLGLNAREICRDVSHLHEHHAIASKN